MTKSKPTDEIKASRYAQIIQKIFERHYREGEYSFAFERQELKDAAAEIDVRLPENLGDLIYSFRYRTPLPEVIRRALPPGTTNWVIWPAGKSRYEFVATNREVQVLPNSHISNTLIPDSTPGVIASYALSDEQALLAKIRYCRLIDVFTGVTCYSLQSHLRTQVKTMGQGETDEIYVGVDKRGTHYVFPIQAKGKKDWLSVVQAAQDIAMCELKFPSLVCRSISAQFMPDESIALFSFEKSLESRFPDQLAEKHYKLVAHNEIGPDDLRRYREAPHESTV